MSIIQKSWRDFLSPAMIALNVLPVVFGIVCWAVILFYFSDNLLGFINRFFPISWQNQLLISDSFLTNIMKGTIYVILYAFLGFFVVVFACVGNMFVSLFYTPLVVRYVYSKHYPTLPKPKGISLFDSLKAFFKMFVLFCAGLVVCIPFLFMPFVGAIVMLIPHFIFFYKATLFDVGTEILGKQNYEHFMQEKNNKLQIAFAAYALGFIPVFNFFAPLLQILIFTHFCFANQALLESSEPDSKS